MFRTYVAIDVCCISKCIQGFPLGYVFELKRTYLCDLQGWPGTWVNTDVPYCRLKISKSHARERKQLQSWVQVLSSLGHFTPFWPPLRDKPSDLKSYPQKRLKIHVDSRKNLLWIRVDWYLPSIKLFTRLKVNIVIFVWSRFKVSSELN